MLEGSVRKAGDQVRITAQLVGVAGGFQLWSESYDRTLDNIFAVQDEIANAIVDVTSREGITLPDPKMTLDGRLAVESIGSPSSSRLSPKGTAEA